MLFSSQSSFSELKPLIYVYHLNLCSPNQDVTTIYIGSILQIRIVVSHFIDKPHAPSPYDNNTVKSGMKDVVVFQK
jgi:hypothetical protein